MLPKTILLTFARSNAVRVVVRGFVTTFLAGFAYKLGTDTYDTLKRHMAESQRPGEQRKR